MIFFKSNVALFWKRCMLLLRVFLAQPHKIRPYVHTDFSILFYTRVVVGFHQRINWNACQEANKAVIISGLAVSFFCVCVWRVYGMLVYLPTFEITAIYVSCFQDSGKYYRRKTALNILVINNIQLCVAILTVPCRRLDSWKNRRHANWSFIVTVTEARQLLNVYRSLFYYSWHSRKIEFNFRNTWDNPSNLTKF